MEELAIRIGAAIAIVILIGLSWKLEVVKPVAERIMRVTPLRPRSGHAMTTVRVPRSRPIDKHSKGQR
jgi:hypothetical protein